MVNSTALSERLDPEELRDVIRAYQRVGAEAINRFGGYVARYLGDALLAYFGYPRAHEQDPHRAVRAGLEIIATLPQLNAQLQKTIEVVAELPLQVRIGIHTGLVVAGEMGAGASPDRTAIVGETPNVAARIQALAPPDSVVLSAVTRRLIQGYFTCHSLGLQTLKGISAPLELHRVIGASGAHNRFDVMAGASLTPLVGRDEELALLVDRWDEVREGHGQVVMLTGEPGIGKSRLVHELEERAARDGCTRVQFRCSPYYENTALYPVIEHIQHLLQFNREDSAREKLQKLDAKLEQHSLPLQEVAPLFAALLSLPHPEHYPPLNVSPQRQKEKTQEALVAWLEAEAERKPVLATWEDLQWADPSTLELLNLFVGEAPKARILSLLTFRPDFAPPWPTRSYFTPITLARLPRKQVETLALGVTGNRTLPEQVMREVVAKTDGVPLFVEEVIKMVRESDLLTEKDGRYELTGPLPPLAIPATLHDSLMARLDQLADSRGVAQLASTLGREFRYELLRAVSPLDEASLQRELGRLTEAQLLCQEDSFPRATYIFKHALIQETAYESLLKSTRQQYHLRIAQVLEEQFRETVETQPELLAHHFTSAGLNDQAVKYWLRAGQRAIERSANQEAIAHLTKGLELLRAMPEGPERTERELMLQAPLRMALTLTKGYATPEMAQAYARARELCMQLGETPHLYPVLGARWAYHLVRSDFQASHEICLQLLALAERQHDTDLLLQAHTWEGMTCFHRCELSAARTHCETAISLYDFSKHGSHALVYGQDPGVVSRAVLAWALWIQGYPQQALARQHEYLSLARERAHNHTTAFALGYGAALCQLLRDPSRGKEIAERGIAFSTEQGFPYWSLCASYTLGWALNQLGQPEAAVTCLRSAADAWQAMGARATRSHQLGLLADALSAAGRTQEGLSILDEALAEVGSTNERYYEAELYRLRGELLLKLPEPNEDRAATSFHQSLEVARELGARSWELRTAMGLARLEHKQGRSDHARDVLAKVYGWFTEGFDTPDVKDARAMLAELGAR